MPAQFMTQMWASSTGLQLFSFSRFAKFFRFLAQHGSRHSIALLWCVQALRAPEFWQKNMKPTSKSKTTTSKKKTPRPRVGAIDKRVPSRAQARRIVEKGAKTITEADIKKVHMKSKEIEEQFNKGPLREFMDNARLLLDIVSDYWTGKYRQIPYFSIAAIVFTLLYVLSPIDLIPDFIPVIGLLDDAAVVSICLFLVLQDLREYEAWKINQSRKEKMV
jgi:uncharacterized membrane protein YkvA (DUF1232 family)